MRCFVILLLVLLPALPALGEDEAGTTCDLQALLDPDDAGLLVAYDGLRKGLEIARLPRVCRHDPAPDTGGVAGFLERRAMAAAPLRENGKLIEPFFAIGDASCAAVQDTGTNLPCVMAVTRYTAKRRPLQELPRTERGSVVYADVAAEQVGSLVRSMGKAGRAKPYVGGGWIKEDAVTKAFEAAASVDAAAGWMWQPNELKGERELTFQPLVFLSLRLDPTKEAMPFAQLLHYSREHKVPIVSDNRAHFGLGAVVVIVPRHDLLGKAAADEGRKLRAGGTPRKEARAVPGFEVWVDLAAADAIGFDLPLAFLARADRIKRARRPASGATR